MLSVKTIELPSIHVYFCLLCSCQVSSHSEYFIIIYVSLMSHVGGKTLISDHRVKGEGLTVKTTFFDSRIKSVIRHAIIVNFYECVAPQMWPAP